MIAHTAYRISSTRILLFRILCILDVSCCAPCPRAFSATRARRSTATGAASVRTRSTASSLAPDTRRATHMGTSAPVTRGTPNMSISADCLTVSGCAATAALRCSGTGVTSDGATMMPPDGAGDASAGCRGTVCRPVSGSKATAESNAIQTVSQDRIAREVRRGLGASLTSLAFAMRPSRLRSVVGVKLNLLPLQRQRHCCLVRGFEGRGGVGHWVFLGV